METGRFPLSDARAVDAAFLFFAQETLSQAGYSVLVKISAFMISILPSSFHIVIVLIYFNPGLLHPLGNPLENVLGTVKAEMCFRGKTWLRN